MLSTMFVHRFRRQHGVLRLPDIFTPYPGQKGSNLNPAVILSLFFSIIFQSTILDQIYCQIILRCLHVLTTQLFNIILRGKPIRKWMNRSSLFERRKPKVRWLEVCQRRHHLCGRQKQFFLYPVLRHHHHLHSGSQSSSHSIWCILKDKTC